MQATYIEKHPDWGVIGVRTQQDEKHAESLIRKHLGEDYVILDTYETMKVPTTNGFDPNAGMKPADSTKTTSKEGYGWYIKYAKKNSPMAQLPPGGIGMSGVQPQPVSGFAGTQPVAATPRAGGLPEPDFSSIQQSESRQPAPVTRLDNSAGKPHFSPPQVTPQSGDPRQAPSGLPAYNPYEK
jgi:hypothetical protein